MKFSFNVELYSRRVKFATTKEELGIETDHKFLCCHFDDAIYILTSDIFGSYSSISFLRCLSHECNHAAFRILHESGVPISVENQEALCYLQDFIFSSILNRIRSRALKGVK